MLEFEVAIQLYHLNNMTVKSVSDVSQKLKNLTSANSI